MSGCGVAGTALAPADALANALDGGCANCAVALVCCCAGVACPPLKAVADSGCGVAVGVGTGDCAAASEDRRGAWPDAGSLHAQILEWMLHTNLWQPTMLCDGCAW